MFKSSRRATLGAHTSGLESIVDHMSDDSMMVQGLSSKRWLMLAIFALAFYINEVPLYGNYETGDDSSYFEYFAFFPLFYTSIYWLEEVGHYQTLMFAMVFQSISVLIAKTGIDDFTGGQGSPREAVAEILNTVA